MDGIGLHLQSKTEDTMREKFEAYLAVQEMGAYNMLDPRARELAQEFCDETITRGDWINIIQNYQQLKEKYS